jgi:hypothetical protein
VATLAKLAAKRLYSRLHKFVVERLVQRVDLT